MFALEGLGTRVLGLGRLAAEDAVRFAGFVTILTGLTGLVPLLVSWTVGFDAGEVSGTALVVLGFTGLVSFTIDLLGGLGFAVAGDGTGDFAGVLA
jgi:hypothetical protein